MEILESEVAIDAMVDETIDADRDSSNGDGDESDDYLAHKDGVIKDKMKNESISIASAMDRMDSIIDEVTGSSEKIDSILEGLSDTEKLALADRLKKKV